MKTIIILGGYGNFGKRIVQSLATMHEVNIYVAGRSLLKAKTCIEQLQSTANATLLPLAIDIFADDFTQQLQQISPFLVIHTSGPFQGQDYRVPKACIEVSAHYIDLADDRKYVCDISTLDAKAKEKALFIVSGASSVPGLSSAVIDHYQTHFSAIHSLDLAIAPGNKAERGLATVHAILTYTGHPFKAFKHGQWQDIYGWMDTRKNDFADIVGKRHLANVDVPDLALFPEHYKVKERVSFQAGLELPILHLTMVAMAYLAKIKIVKNWSPLAKAIVKTSDLFLPFGTDKGAMEVLINGLDHKNKAKTIKWTLYAPNGNGPYIPTLSTIILAKKLLLNTSDDLADNYGAKPCVGLVTLADFIPYFDSFNIYYQAQ